MSEPVVAFPVASPETVDTEDRRRALRYLGKRLCYVKPNGKNSGAAWGARLEDISLHGLSLVLRCRLQVGTVIAVHPARGNIRQALFARVARTEEHEHGWLHGCEFLRPIENMELYRWLNG